VVRIARAFVFCRVARIALGREALELPGSGASVARFAVHSRMRADQRKAILVVANRRYGYLPALDGMTRFAIRAELAAVNVRVAVRAFLSDVRKDQLDVALGALHFLVHAPQWVTRFIVAKFGNTSDRFPAQGRMAVLTGDIESGTVRIPRNRLLSRTLRPLSVCLERKQKDRDL
jgi:hypothetical protein